MKVIHISETHQESQADLTAVSETFNNLVAKRSTMEAQILSKSSRMTKNEFQELKSLRVSILFHARTLGIA